MKKLLVVILALIGMNVIGEEVKTDTKGMRVLSKLPKAGVHPRVFFTKEELPKIRARLETTEFGKKFLPTVKQVVSQIKKQWGPFANENMDSVTKEQIEKYFKSDEGRNIRWGIVSIYAVAFDDPELKKMMAKVITNYAKIMITSKEMAIGGDSALKTSPGLGKTFNFWKANNYDVGVSWMIGAAGLAVSYDVLYNNMTKEQQDTVRKAIAYATKGRKSYGMDLPKSFAGSNHFGYHGDLLVLLSAIEGEKGFDKPTYDNIKRVLQNYWDVSFTAKGACHEDGYGPNLGLRAGSRALMALARRGYNIFKTNKYRGFIDYNALEYEPYPKGFFVGGASGGPYDELYPTSTLIMRYMYPNNTAANYAYRHTVGDNYDRHLRWQGWLDYMIYGSDWKGPVSREKMLKESGLPLSVYYPERGKVVARNDWSTDALQFTLDARPDAFMIGHDSVDRGNFTLSALGRMWAFTGDFHYFNGSEEHSLVHIDGKAEAWKAPSVKMLGYKDDGKTVRAAADLKYAYDWQWTPPWPKVGEAKYASWEEEKSNPVDLGWPAKLAPGWLPKEIYGSDTGYAWKNGLKKRPYNKVESAFRTTMLVRGKHPYVIIADNVKKDNISHKYEWYMQAAMDLVIKSQTGNSIILGDEKDEEREMLVQVLRADGDNGKTAKKVSAKLETYVAHEDKKKGTKMEAKRLIISVDSKDPNFQILLLPYKTGTKLPEFKWNAGRTELSVVWADKTDKISFKTVPGKATALKLLK